MGLGALIVGAVSVVGSAIAGALSAAGTFIAGTIAKIGPVISKVAETFMSVVAQIPKIDLETVNKVFDVAGGFLHSCCEVLGIKSEEDPSILGAKANQSDKSLEEFDYDTAAYIRYLKEEIELDKDKYDKMSTEEKIGCKAIGLALETKAIEDKLEIDLSPECVTMLAKIQIGKDIVLSANNLIEIAKTLKDAGITDMDEVKEYFEGKGDSDRVTTGEKLKEAVAQLEGVSNPDQMIEDIKMYVREKD